MKFSVCAKLFLSCNILFFTNLVLAATDSIGVANAVTHSSNAASSQTISPALSSSASPNNSTVGPTQVASVDNSLWPESIKTSAGFDKASRAALIIYLTTLQQMQALSDEEILAAFKIKSVNRAQVDQWIAQEKNQTFINYQHASINCSANDWTCLTPVKDLNQLLALILLSKSSVPQAFQAWNGSVESFTRTYIGEQMRLAALFPKVTSEIATFSNNEWTGSGFADKQFYLTFDDGPTSVNGHTDETLLMLAEQKKSATFFILGNYLQQRVTNTSSDAVKHLYGNHCVALHGWEHQSHAKWDLWQDSVLRTQALVGNTIEKNNISPLFRPPYGQRKEDSGEFFKQQHLQVALWNIDSQDWSAKIDAKAVEGRIILLMLIKRHGVILFHDIHPKAKQALPAIFTQLGDAVVWAECKTLFK